MLALKYAGNLIVFPLETVSEPDTVFSSLHKEIKVAEYSPFTSAKFLPEACMYVSEPVLALHNMILNSDESTLEPEDMVEIADICCECTCMISESSLKEHYRDGHRPSMLDKCPWCSQGGMRHRKSVRVAHEDRLGKKGFCVSFDYTGPHDEDVDWFKFGLVGVELGSSMGIVGLHKDRTAVQGLETVKQFESLDLKQASKDSSREINEFHHDDDKSFRGVVEVHAREESWEDTNTGGHDPSANGVCERRIGMASQNFRVNLLCATGGNTYYEALWGRGLVYPNDIINTAPWPDRESPLSYLAGEYVPLSKNRHVFGAYCLYFIDPKQRTGKWQPTSEMGIWVGLSPDVNKGHLICPIKWDAVNKVWIIMPTVTCRTVKVYDDKFPLRMTPTGTTVSPENFHKFVDKVCNPMFTESEPKSVSVSKPSSKPVAEKPEPKKKAAKPKKSDSTEYEVEYIKKPRMKNGKL